MVRDMGGIKVIELGKGTTFVGQIKIDGASASSGICFSNKSLDGQLQGDEVMIEITNIRGVLLYIKGVVELLKTWEIKGMEQIEKFSQFLDETLAEEE